MANAAPARNIYLDKILDDPITHDLCMKCVDDVKSTMRRTLELCDTRDAQLAVCFFSAYTAMHGAREYSNIKTKVEFDRFLDSFLATIKALAMRQWEQDNKQ